MYSRVYFDTNVIVDFFDKKRVFHKESIAIFKKLSLDEDIELFINSDTMTNLFYILRNHVKLDFDVAIEKMELIKDSFSIVSIGVFDIDSALGICKKKQFDDYEDALQYVCALKVECNLIVTNNAKDFKNLTIEIATTKELSQINDDT